MVFIQGALGSKFGPLLLSSRDVAYLGIGINGRETSIHIAYCWKCLNSTLNDVQGMMDEAGVHFCHVKEEFGLNFILQKVVSCQQHCKSNVNKQSGKLY